MRSSILLLYPLFILNLSLLTAYFFNALVTFACLTFRFIPETKARTNLNSSIEQALQSCAEWLTIRSGTFHCEQAEWTYTPTTKANCHDNRSSALGRWYPESTPHASTPFLLREHFFQPKYSTSSYLIMKLLSFTETQDFHSIHRVHTQYFLDWIKFSHYFLQHWDFC